MLKFQLVLPCYNESKSLENLIKRAAQAATDAGYTSEEFQLILVENGSKDDSSLIMDELSKTDLGKWFKKVTVKVNQGYGFGLHQGLLATQAPMVGWSHADQQCDPKDAFRALAIASQNKNLIVKGVRFGRNWKDIFVSRVFELIAWLALGLRVYEINAQPKVFSRALLGQLKDPPKTFAFDLYVLYHAKKMGLETKTIEVEFPPRIHGASRWAATFMGRYKTILGMIRYMFVLAKREGRISVVRGKIVHA